MERKTRGRRSEPRCPDAGCRPRARAARPGTGAIRGAQSLPEVQPPSCPACEPPPAPPVSPQPHSENEQGRGQPWAGLAEPGSRGASVCWDVTPGGSALRVSVRAGGTCSLQPLPRGATASQLRRGPAQRGCLGARRTSLSPQVSLVSMLQLPGNPDFRAWAGSPAGLRRRLGSPHGRHSGQGGLGEGVSSQASPRAQGRAGVRLLGLPAPATPRSQLREQREGMAAPPN